MPWGKSPKKNDGALKEREIAIESRLSCPFRAPIHFQSITQGVAALCLGL